MIYVLEHNHWNPPSICKNHVWAPILPLLFLTVDGGIDNIISSEDQSCMFDGGDNSDTASDGGNNKSSASEHLSSRE